MVKIILNIGSSSINACVCIAGGVIIGIIRKSGSSEIMMIIGRGYIIRIKFPGKKFLVQMCCC